jgi:hypothetical protein
MPDPTNTNVGTLQANEPDLQPEEIAALAADKPLVEGVEAVVADPAAVVDPAAVPAPGAAAAAAPAAEAVVAAVEEPPVAAAPPPSGPIAPSYTPSARDFKAELAAVDAERNTLKEAYKAGTVDDEKYEAEFERLNETRGDLRLEIRAETLKAELSQQNQDHSWAYLQTQWLARPENAALTGNPLLFSAWSSAMQMAVDEAAGQGKALGDWDLMEAGRAKLAAAGMLGVVAATAAPVPGAAVVTGPGPKPANDKPAFSAVPVTLSGAPSAADPGARTTVDDLSSVDIEDLEDRMATYSDAQREALLKQVPGSASYEAI